jgi:small subunit ribosomal protein S7
VSRRKSAVKRTILPDARYDSQTVSKFINSLMVDGKKNTAEGIFYSAMDIVEDKTSQPGVTVFKQALNNLKPVVEVKSRRVGGATYQVPVEVRQDRRNALAMRWLISYSRDRNEKSMEREAGRGNPRGLARRRQRDEEEGRHAPHGRSQQGVRALPLVIVVRCIANGPCTDIGAGPVLHQPVASHRARRVVCAQVAVRPSSRADRLPYTSEPSCSTMRSDEIDAGIDGRPTRARVASVTRPSPITGPNTRASSLSTMSPRLATVPVTTAPGSSVSVRYAFTLPRISVPAPMRNGPAHHQ